MNLLKPFRAGIVFLAAILALANALAWLGFSLSKPSGETLAQNLDGKSLSGIAYSPYQRWDDPVSNKNPSDEAIASDLDWLSGRTKAIRTYTSAQFQSIPRLAAQRQLEVTQGVFLNANAAHDQKEIMAAIGLARTEASIKRVIVGNETLLKGIQTQSELAKHIRMVKAEIKQPVSTAEPWHVWLASPELADQVDFITVHLLPYWEGINAHNAVGHALYQLQQVKLRFPNKPVIIGEIGWPSAGNDIKEAHASPANQAAFIREFLSKIDQAPTPYFLMEAFDQPWKQAEEGKAGGYWGIADATRHVKFELSGPVETDPFWSYKALASSLLGFVLVLSCLPRLAHLRPTAQFTFAAFAQVLAAGIVVLVTQPLLFYLQPSEWVALLILIPTLLVMVVILLAHAFEFVELFWEGGLRRQFASARALDVSAQPKVSIHLACCNEDPDMVIATIKSLLALNYPNFEVIVVDNNTRSPDCWKPVEAFVAATGDSRVQFFHLPHWPGYKAGALNFALCKTSADAEIIGVVDADYLVKPLWLARLTGYFSDAKIGIVQAPQAHRDWGNQVFRSMMNWEYDGFFRIGMHHRNERDAIVQHGTMTLIRAQALRAHGAWDEDCVCEDSELGLRLMSHAWKTVYVDEVFGQGLTPDSFMAYRKQRQRWAEGAIQILKKHRSALLSEGSLSRGQRYHFLAGWLPWIGDALHLLFVVLALVWTVGSLLAPTLIQVPTALFMAPLATFVLVKLCIGPLLYWQRVPCTAAGIAGASVAGMAVAHAVARGVIAGVFRRKTAFIVTQKGSNAGASASRKAWSAIREEISLLTALFLAAIAFLALGPNGQEHWVFMLALQALPYAAAVLCTWLSLAPQQKALANQSTELT